MAFSTPSVSEWREKPCTLRASYARWFITCSWTEWRLTSIPLTRNASLSTTIRLEEQKCANDRLNLLPSSGGIESLLSIVAIKWREGDVGGIVVVGGLGIIVPQVASLRAISVKRMGRESEPQRYPISQRWTEKERKEIDYTVS